MAEDNPPENDTNDSQEASTGSQTGADDAVGPSPDPSNLLASAADALESIDDPKFEGAKVPESNSPPPGSSTPATDHSRAVLAIETPVAVVLARQKISVQRVVDLVPGSMLTFDSHCDEPLTLEAGGHPIAVGETVKIGDKFGLRIRQLLESTDEI